MEELSNYWQQRYVSGGNSGAGSYGEEAKMKGSLINHWMKLHEMRTINEIGCGDGNNLMYYNVDISYTGYDISERAIQICNEKTRKIKNSLKYFFTTEYDKQDFDADVCLCLDVWFHQVKDEDFEALCKNLFVDFRGKYIIIYSTDTDSQFMEDGTPVAPHMRPREVLSKVAEYPQWKLKFWCSGYRDVNDRLALFPSTKKFFLFERV